jgi:hypothetical protein
MAQDGGEGCEVGPKTSECGLTITTPGLKSRKTYARQLIQSSLYAPKPLFDPVDFPPKFSNGVVEKVELVSLIVLTKECPRRRRIRDVRKRGAWISFGSSMRTSDVPKRGTRKWFGNSIRIGDIRKRGMVGNSAAGRIRDIRSRGTSATGRIGDA